MEGPLQIPKEWLKPHPVLRLPTREQLVAAVRSGPEAVARVHAVLEERYKKILLEQSDPLRHAYEPETWTKARELLIEHDELDCLGANRSGKTRFAAKYTVEQLVQKPGQVWAFFHTSEKASIRQQQSIVHAHLPPEWRDLGKVGADVYVKYTKVNGFSNQTFILPNGSTALFFNYKQGTDVLEGYELDGVWFDEEVPLAFIEALEFRVGQGRRLTILKTFTPVSGYIPAIARSLSGAKLVESRAAHPELLDPNVVHVKGCPPGHMPYVMRCRNPKAAVLFFHWGMNPYGANQEVKDKLVGATTAKVKIRAYGFAEKLIASALPKYSDAHRISREKFNAIAARGGTRYVVTDPGGTKNWVIKWYFVTPEDWTILYREWPDFQRFGEWALPAEDADGKRLRVDWKPGPAQRLEAGRGISGYKRLVLETEGWFWDPTSKKWIGEKAERIERRLMDPRFGGMAVPGQDDGTSIIELMDEEHRHGDMVLPRMIWEPAVASRVEESVQMIAERMDWNEEQPLTTLNCPKWYVVDDLLQSDLAYREFTGLGSDKDALKDLIDPDRYLVKSDCGYVKPGAMRVRRGGHW